MPTSWVALAVALLAVVPGFIATTTWSRARTWKGPSGDLRTVLQSLALSAAIQVLLSPLTVVWIAPVRSHLADHAWRTAAWFVCGVLVLPVLLGLLFARVTDLVFDPKRSGSDKADEPRFARLIAKIVKSPPPPTMWDWLFTVQPPASAFVQLEYNDGSRLGGVFAEGSQVLTSPEPHGLFLEEEWLIDDDGNFTSLLPGTGGLLITDTTGLRAVRILRSADDSTD
jgi:hypothetical protein